MELSKGVSPHDTTTHLFQESRFGRRRYAGRGSVRESLEIDVSVSMLLRLMLDWRNGWVAYCDSLDDVGEWKFGRLYRVGVY